MPSSTANRSYPYPLDADLIDTAGDIQALAEAVDVDNAAQQTQITTLTSKTNALAAAGWASNEVRPSGNADSGGGPTATIWVSATAPAAPSFATSVLVTMAVTGHYAFTAGANVFRLNLRQASTGAGGGQMDFHDAGVLMRLTTCVVVAAFSITPGSVQTYQVWATRVVGTGILRADADTVFSYRYDYSG